MSDYSFLTRPELIQLLLHNKTELNKQLIKTEPADAPGKKSLTEIKKRLETEIKAIEAKLKESIATVTTPAAAPTAAPPAAVAPPAARCPHFSYQSLACCVCTVF